MVSKDLSKLTKKEKLEVKKLTLIHNAIQNYIKVVPLLVTCLPKLRDRIGPLQIYQ